MFLAARERTLLGQPGLEGICDCPVGDIFRRIGDVGVRSADPLSDQFYEIRKCGLYGSLAALIVFFIFILLVSVAFAGCYSLGAVSMRSRSRGFRPTQTINFSGVIQAVMNENYFGCHFSTIQHATVQTACRNVCRLKNW